MRKSWRLSGGSDTLVIIHRSDLKKDEEPIKPVFLTSFIDRWLSDPLSRKTILDIYQSVGGAVTIDKLSPQKIHRYVKPQLENAFLRGDLLAVRPPRSPSVAGQKEAQDIKPKPASAEKKQEKEKTWIKLRLIDDKSNRPITGLKLTVNAPNGLEINGVTNSDGTIEIKNINDGACTITSPVKMTRLDKTFNFDGMGEKQTTSTSTGTERHPESAINGDGMAIAIIKRHKVKTGETLDSLAKTNGLTWQELAEFNWGTSKTDEINKKLRSDIGCTRKTKDSKNYMFDDSDKPGIIFIPCKWEQNGLSTTKTYTFRLSQYAFSTESYIWIEVHDSIGLYDSEPFKIEVNGKVIEGKTTPHGVIEAMVPKDAMEGDLTIGGYTYKIKLLDDEIGDSLEATQIRLNNLGFYCGQVDGIWGDRSKAAMKLFQSKFTLPPTGKADDDSLALLKKVHDLKDDHSIEHSPVIEEDDSVIPEESVDEEYFVEENPESNPLYFA